jgi:hypothetical protein
LSVGGLFILSTTGRAGSKHEDIQGGPPVGPLLLPPSLVLLSQVKIWSEAAIRHSTTSSKCTWRSINQRKKHSVHSITSS